jgi:CRISPR-associated endonuclease/helicase Cas3
MLALSGVASVPPTTKADSLRSLPQEPSLAGLQEPFLRLTGHCPMEWQRRLYSEFIEGRVPSVLDLPTGLGKTSVMAIWLIARAQGAGLPRRLVYIVDRRAVVDQATAEAEKLRNNAEAALGIGELPISTLRGQFVDNREWLADPAASAIVVGTVDMLGSRLLFSGYGVSPRMRPYHAGLLGADTLVVLDEAHLVPSFAHLLRAIEQDASLWPRDASDRALLPRFAVLPLSATQRDSYSGKSGRVPFQLEEADWRTDRIARKRLEAKKHLPLEPLSQRDQDQQLAAAAWALAVGDGKPSRVVVFCDRRDRQDEGGGPSAQGVADAIRDFAKGDKKTGRIKRELYPVELLVGGRRVYERDGVATRLRTLGFIGEKEPLDMPAFLVATSAGEVGVDIDADHMVSDLSAWERMVQRLGRVNRRGEGNAEVKVFWGEPAIKNVGSPTEQEKRALNGYASKDVIEALPRIDGGFDVSPGALRALATSARQDVTLQALVDAATTPEPLRPALNRALVDAWSLTSLDGHMGRPEVAPWLRGWVSDDAPQTTIVWRGYLPLRDGAPDWPSTRKEEEEIEEIEDFFEAAPPHESEKLETETYRVVTWLQRRSQALLKITRLAAEESARYETPEEGAPAAAHTGAEASDGERIPPPAQKLERGDTVALTLSPSGDYICRYRLGDLAQERKGDARKDFELELAGKCLVIDARFSGLKDGLLDPEAQGQAKTADTSTEWNKRTQFRVRRVKALDESLEEEWRFEDAFVVLRSAEGDDLEWLVVEHFRAAARKEDARSVARPQELALHQEWARRRASRIADGIGLSGGAKDALVVAAALHDEGKKAERWQRAFKAKRDAERCGLSGPLAKTRGPIDHALLDGYRHEFGSLPYVETNIEFRALPEEWQDLVLHLIAAHHGFARPVIETRGCEDAPPSVLGARARNITLRFARLQKRWGPWGLAWWEALLRAADAQASRDNDEGRVPPE